MKTGTAWNLGFFTGLGHANCPPPYPLAGLHGAILYPPPPKNRV